MNAETYMTPDEVYANLQSFNSREPQIKASELGEVAEQSLIHDEKLEDFFGNTDGVIPCEIEVDAGIDVTSLPQSVDLRKYDTPVDNQGREGRCTADASLNCLMLKISKETGKKLDMSEWFHWRNYKQYNSWVAATTLCKHWQGEEKYWPDNANQGKPGWEESRIATLSAPRELQSIIEMQKHLARGEPIHLSVGLDGAYWTNAVILGDRGTQKSGHAIMVLGYVIDARWNSGGYFIIKNSWGTGFGDKGYNYIAFDYFTSNRFWTNCIVYSDKINWKPGKEPGKVTPKPDVKLDLRAVAYLKYKYTPADSAEHGAYGVRLEGNDLKNAASVKWNINSSLPISEDKLDFGKTFGTFAQSGWAAGTAEVTMQDGSTRVLNIKIP